MRDRLTRLGDPEFVPFPDEILDSAYHHRMVDAIRANEVGTAPPASEAGSTTHLATADAEGNVVTVTQTLLSLWGSGVVAGGTGVVMNNGMMWFDPEPGRPNSIEGGKLALANMCPVLVTRDGEPILAFGASGGRRIMPALVQILMRVAWLGWPFAEAVAAPRIDVNARGVIADERFGAPFIAQIGRKLGRPILSRPPVLGGSPWASPVGVARLEDGRWTAGGDMYTMACAVAP
jgi:gamma-glutamyltranspeptidase/glutathione hydrolase